MRPPFCRGQPLFPFSCIQRKLFVNIYFSMWKLLSLTKYMHPEVWTSAYPLPQYSNLLNVHWNGPKGIDNYYWMYCKFTTDTENHSYNLCRFNTQTFKATSRASRCARRILTQVVDSSKFQLINPLKGCKYPKHYCIKDWMLDICETLDGHSVCALSFCFLTFFDLNPWCSQHCCGFTCSNTKYNNLVVSQQRHTLNHVEPGCLYSFT